MWTFDIFKSRAWIHLRHYSQWARRLMMNSLLLSNYFKLFLIWWANTRLQPNRWGFSWVVVGFSCFNSSQVDIGHLWSMIFPCQGWTHHCCNQVAEQSANSILNPVSLLFWIMRSAFSPAVSFHVLVSSFVVVLIDLSKENDSLFFKIYLPCRTQRHFHMIASNSP